MQQLLSRHVLNDGWSIEQRDVRELHSRLILKSDSSIVVRRVPDLRGRLIFAIFVACLPELLSGHVLNDGWSIEQRDMRELHPWILLEPDSSIVVRNVPDLRGRIILSFGIDNLQ